MPHEKSPDDLATVRDAVEKRLEEEIKKDKSLEGIRGVQIPQQLAEFTKAHVYLGDHMSNNMLWAKPLEYWLAAYRSAFPVFCANWPEDKELYAIVFEERANRLLRYCLECNMRGRKVSLWSLARQIYHESDGNFDKFCPKVRDDILLPMDKAGLWNVFVTTTGRRSSPIRIHTNPHVIREKGVRYDIRAGEVLWSFCEYLLVPWRDKQVRVLRDFLDKFD